MQLPKSPASLAGFLSLITGAMMLPFWYIYLFVGAPSGMSPGEVALSQLHYDFSNDTILRWYLLLQAVVPLILVAVGIQYLRGKARVKRHAVVLVLIVAVTAVGAIALNYWELLVLLAAIVYYGVLCARDA
jgi:hypothetical protein